MDKYLMGKEIVSWRNDDAQVMTFVVTQDCNLSCKYCYMVHKSDAHTMEARVAKDAVDYFIQNKDTFSKDYIILEFIGGEPLLEIELIDEIVDYFKIQTYLKKCKWFGRYRISISTNGLMYTDPKVQRFIKKNKNMVSIGISIDGTKEKHDLQRVFSDGSGSYDKVLINVQEWLKQLPESVTKVTIGHDDLRYVKDSIIHLWEIGIREVPANVVFEDVWEEGDDRIFEEQLMGLADYIIDNKLWDTYNTTLFSDYIGYKVVDDEWERNFCGTGKSYTIDADGAIYPCVRYLDYSLANKSNINFGSIYTGVDKNKIRPFYLLNMKNQSPEKCLECSVGSGCSYCQAYNYDASKHDTNFDRATFICEMHKARCRANNYYWAKLKNIYGIDRSPRKFMYRSFDKHMYILLSGDSVSVCHYGGNYVNDSISEELLLTGLEYARRNFYQPIIVYSNDYDSSRRLLDQPIIRHELEKHISLHMIKYDINSTEMSDSVIYIFNKNNINSEINSVYKNVILVVENNDIHNLSLWIEKLLVHSNRINIKLEVNTLDYLNIYDKELKKITDILRGYYKKNIFKEIDILTDRLFLNEMDNCCAGEKDITLGPDGKFYICPAFYYKNEHCGILSKDENFSISMTKLDKAPLCVKCEAYQCERCVYLNKYYTNEYNIPSEYQCRSAILAQNHSENLLEFINANKIFNNMSKIKNIKYTEVIKN